MWWLENQCNSAEVKQGNMFMMVPVGVSVSLKIDCYHKEWNVVLQVSGSELKLNIWPEMM
jgi:hypothetical protein